MHTHFIRRAGILLALFAFAACASPPPILVSVEPGQVCGDGGTVTITGMDLQEGAILRLINDSTEVDVMTTYVDSETLNADTGVQSGGTYDVLIENPDGQVSEILPDALTIVPNPIVIFVDPPVVWNGLSVEATIYASGVVGAVQSVEIAPSGSTDRMPLDFTQDGERPNRIYASVPSGLAAGSYDLYVMDEMCEGRTEGGLQVVEETALTLSEIDPPFGWTGDDTAVTITADTSAGPGFAPTPRVYLSPAGGGVAQPARAVTYQDEATISAIVPAGLTPGDYDVIAINPDATVGVLAGAFTVTADAPPTILEATPGQIDSGTTTAITLTGTGFAMGAEVTLFCVDALGNPLPDVMLTPDNISGAGDSLTFTTPDLDAGTVCVVRVTNVATDGSYGDFSAISVTNPASNLEPFQSSTTAPDVVMPLAMARSGLGLVAGRVSRSQRFLYAIAGDDGDGANATDTVESTQIDLFGHMLGWSVQTQGSAPRPMTTTRTGLGATRIGQYLYAAGGADASGAALASIERARILDPLQVPELDDLAITLDETSGLAPGGWVYRVSAITPTDGESLPSEPINVTVPVLADETQNVQITITWTAVPEATGYRVYRTRTPDETAGDVALLAEVTETTYSDDGATPPPADAVPPLAIGALGEWHEVGTMSTGRIGAGVTAARGASGDEWFLYVGGGSDGAAALDTYEYVQITIDPTDGSQEVGALMVGARSIGTGRWHLSAWRADSSNVTSAGADGFVYFGSGEPAMGTQQVRETVAGRVNQAGGAEPAGELIAVDAAVLDSVSPSTRTGVAAITSAGFLYEFGGGPTPTAGGTTAEVCRPGLAGCSITTPPELRNWNSLGDGGILVPRYLPGAAIESAFIFVVGGTTTGGAATDSVERTIR